MLERGAVFLDASSGAVRPTPFDAILFKVEDDTLTIV
jgi:hypothetical protein